MLVFEARAALRRSSYPQYLGKRDTDSRRHKADQSEQDQPSEETKGSRGSRRGKSLFLCLQSKVSLNYLVRPGYVQYPGPLLLFTNTKPDYLNNTMIRLDHDSPDDEFRLRLWLIKFTVARLL